MPERFGDWWLVATGQCRVCGSSAMQSAFWPEVYARSGQALTRCGYCATVYRAPDCREAGLVRFYTGPYRRLFSAEVAWRSTTRFAAWCGDADMARQRFSLIAANLPPQEQLFEMGSGFGAFLGQASVRFVDRLRRLVEAAGLPVVYCGAHPLTTLAGALWLEALRPATPVRHPVAPAVEELLGAVDQWISRGGWGIGNRLEAQLKALAMRALRPGLIGEWQRWRQYRRQRDEQVPR